MAFVGLETAQRWVGPGGYFAPWVAELGIRIERVDDEGVRARLPYSEAIVRPGGAVIGQALMAVADTLLVIAFCERMKRRATMATVSLTTNFLRASIGKDVIAEARAVRIGRSTAFGQVDMFADGDPDPIAQALATFAVLPDGAATFKPAGSERG